jgi:hypothetical protein
MQLIAMVTLNPDGPHTPHPLNFKKPNSRRCVAFTWTGSSSKSGFTLTAPAPR